MTFAAAWTMSMSVALAALVTCACAIGSGGNLIAWLLAIPAMFLILHLIGIPVVLLCELGERAKLISRRWRPLVDEILAVAILVGAASLILPGGFGLVAAGLFAVMYVLRLVFYRCWIPAEPEEVEG